MKQDSFLPKHGQAKALRAHGGELAKNRRKTLRPLDPKQALHVVLRSSQARGRWSMLDRKHSRHIHDFTHRLAERKGVRIYRFANVGNHVHLLVRARSRRSFQAFLRELSGGIALIVTGARKGASLRKNETGRGFWDYLAFTRIVKWGRDFDGMERYLIKNLFEAMGVPMRRLLAQGYRIVTTSADGAVPDTS